MSASLSLKTENLALINLFNSKLWYSAYIKWTINVIEINVFVPKGKRKKEQQT